MKKFYTAESVTEGHPDKVCDQIADTILDACLKGDSNSHVACEVLATKGTVLLAGEISSSCEPDVLELAEGVVERIGYDPKDFLFDSLIHRQSPDIAEGVRVSREKRQNPAAEADWSMGAGDQGIMTGYACRENPQMLPMPVLLANRIVRELDAARKSEYIRGILPDGKAQVTVEYEDHEPVRLDTVIVSCQHAEEKNLKDLEKEIRQKVLLPALRPLPADAETKIIINPSGRFVVGGMEADTGLTGRKLKDDAYGVCLLGIYADGAAFGDALGNVYRYSKKSIENREGIPSQKKTVSFGRLIYCNLWSVCIYQTKPADIHVS